jgi:cysteine desulfurase/selenocysteine lyase
MLASSWGVAHLSPGDRILLSQMEHHSNLVPWQMVAKRTGAELLFAPLDGHYELDLEATRRMVDERVKIISITGMSNVLGTITPITQLEAIAHSVGAVLIIDGAQLVAHTPIDVTALGADFLAFSSHKMLGPTGVGVLWGRRALLDEMEPFEGGGEMIDDVGLYESTWAKVPQKFEAGTPPFVEAIGLAAAVDYLAEIGMGVVRSEDMALTEYALAELDQIPKMTVYGPRNLEHRGGVISFTMGDVHPHDLATILDEHGVSVRAGHHCARPLMDHLGVPATARASFSVYSDESDVDQLTTALYRAGELFGL